MPLVLYESRDFGQNIHPIWSGAVLIPGNQQIYADTFEVYLVGLHSVYNNFLTRIETATPTYEELDLAPPTLDSPLEMTHYFNEFGYAMYSALIESGDERRVLVNFYPEYPQGWITLSGLPGSAIDVIFPDYPDSPRFVVGFSGNSIEKVYILDATTSGLSLRYATNWTALSPNSSVYDLEVVRFI